MLQIHLHAVFPAQGGGIKTAFHGSKLLSHLQLQLCGKGLSILAVLEYPGSSGNGEYTWPFPASQTAIAAVAAFHFVKQPFVVFAMRVCTVPCLQPHTMGTRARWQHTASGTGPVSRTPCYQNGASSRHGPAAADVHSDINWDACLCLSALDTAEPVSRCRVTPCLGNMNAGGVKQTLGEMQTRHQICSFMIFPTSTVSRKC